MIKVNRSDVKIFPSRDTIFGYHGWGYVTRGFDNELLAVCSGLRLGHVCPFGKVLLSKSFDMGKTWTRPQIIIDTPLDDRDASINIFQKDKLIVTSFNHFIEDQKSYPQSGFKLAMRDAYFSNNRITKEMEAKYYGSTYIISEDKGLTWSDIMFAPVTSPSGPLALKDGSLLYMGNYKMADKDPSKYDKSLTFEKELLVFKSLDGLTWEYLSHVPYVEGPDGKPITHCEPHVIELDDKLVAFIRMQNGIYATYMSQSFDKGKTWSMPQRVNEHGAPAHALKHSSGLVVLVYGYRQKPWGLRAKISKDQCNTWSDEFIIKDESFSFDLGYPSSIELDDGSIFTAYYDHETPDSLCEIFGSTWSLPNLEDINA